MLRSPFFLNDNDMITNKDITTRFMEYYDLHETHGHDIGDGEIVPLLPFLLVDAGWIYVQKDILPLECRRGMKKARTAMKAAYAQHMYYLFAALEGESADYLIDQMDALEGVINNELTRLRVLYHSAFMKECGFGQRQVLSAALICNQLAYLAEVAMDRTYGKMGALLPCRTALAKLRTALREFSKSYMTEECLPNGEVTEKMVEDIDAASVALEKKIVSWLKGERGE